MKQKHYTGSNTLLYKWMLTKSICKKDRKQKNEKNNNGLAPILCSTSGCSQNQFAKRQKLANKKMKRITIAWLEYFDLHVDVSNINFRNCKKLSKQKKQQENSNEASSASPILPTGSRAATGRPRHARAPYESATWGRGSSSYAGDRM